MLLLLVLGRWYELLGIMFGKMMGINIYYNKVNVMVETIPIIDKNV